MGETVQLAKGAPSWSRTGEVISAKYRLERELGRGAMGTVWAAQHLTLGQRVAIKLIAAEHAQSPEARIRFSTEAKAAARLKSRHVVQVYDHGETDEGTPYIVMEYLEGETLEARLDRERELPLVDAVRITAQVARGLSRAHAQGVVHRDLKPANIFLARNDEDELGWTAKVLDFGIAKLDEPTTLSTTKTGAVLGTPLFMSPEQVRGASRVDARSDLYSLGICFYNMLTGRFAFDGESFGDILVAICTDPLPELSEGANAVPLPVSDWFKRCCARSPEDRFQSSDELVESLQAAVGGSLLLVQHGSIPDQQRGPYGTIRGHSAPLSTRTSALNAQDSGAFVAQSQADTAAGAALTERSRSDTATAVPMVRDAPPPEATRSRRTIAIALALTGTAAVLMLGAAALFRSAPETRAGASPSPSIVRASPPATASSPSAVEVAKPAEAASSAPALNEATPTLASPVRARATAVAAPRPRPLGAARPAHARKKAAATDLGF